MIWSAPVVGSDAGAASSLIEGQDAAAGLAQVDRALELVPASLEARLLRGDWASAHRGSPELRQHGSGKG